MRRSLSTLLPMVLLACAASNASAQRYRHYNGMEMTPYGPVQNPTASADYKAFVRNPAGYEAYAAQKEQQAMQKYEQQMVKNQQQYMQQMQKQQKAYDAWKKAHPAEAAAQEKAYREEMARQNAPPGTVAGARKVRKKAPKPFSMATAGKGDAKAKKDAAKADEPAEAKDEAPQADATKQPEAAKAPAKP